MKYIISCFILQISLLCAKDLDVEAVGRIVPYGEIKSTLILSYAITNNGAHSTRVMSRFFAGITKMHVNDGKFSVEILMSSDPKKDAWRNEKRSIPAESDLGITVLEPGEFLYGVTEIDATSFKTANIGDITVTFHVPEDFAKRFNMRGMTMPCKLKKHFTIVKQ